MKRRIKFKAASLLAMLAIALQVLWPGTLAIAASNGADVSSLICATHEQPSADAIAAGKRIAALLGSDAADHQPPSGHCPFCSLVQAMSLPEPYAVAARTEYTSVADYTRSDRNCCTCKVHGSSLGSRGPPYRS